MIASSVGRRYAKALFELASQANQVEPMGKALNALADTLEGSEELRNVIENPRYLPEAKKQVAAAIAQRLGAPPMLVNTVKMLADRRRLGHLRAIADAYGAKAEAKAGRVRVEVTTATALPDAYYRELEKTLSEVTGRQVSLVRRTDASLIGGVVAKIGDTVFDGSIKNRLGDLRQQLLAAAGS